MKFIRSRNIEKVNSYSVSFNKLQYISNNSLYLEDKLLTDNTDCLGIFLNKNLLIYSNYTDYKTYVFNIETDVIKNIGQMNVQNLVYNNYYLGYQYDDNFNSTIVLLNNNFEVKQDIDFKNIIIEFIHDKIGIQNYNREKLVAYLLPSNKILWQIDISQLNHTHKKQDKNVIEAYKILGVFENDLLVILDDSSILRIDIETGEIKKRFNMVLFSDTENEVIAQYNFIQFQDDKLIYYRYGQYAEYDLESNKIIYQFDIKEDLEKEKLHDNIHSYIKEDDLLYFYISGFGSFSFPSIVVLNTRTREIVWKHIWDNQDVFYKDFQKSETALYLLDSGNTLHIFEKI
ncbi:hypothetical protein [Chryseobacterium viscerum]|uniref:Uncharacterized protein n=1 Tax=Chryseobacterium viscerum TaxID=1037377 RepID=A0A316WFU6_9FLAO|nr:hypothetical protein [Chryseobacterium viscerum]PWN59006.1 hypothetical protein C1634_020550 [Chryseobacterium viscerum]